MQSLCPRQGHTFAWQQRRTLAGQLLCASWMPQAGLPAQRREHAKNRSLHLPGGTVIALPIIGPNATPA